MQVHWDLACLFSPSSVPLSSVGSVLCGYSSCERALPEIVTGMLATSSPGYIKSYWCASRMLPKLADDAVVAKAVGGDRCYLSSPTPSSQIVPSNKAINLKDQHQIHSNHASRGMIDCLRKTSIRAAWVALMTHKTKILSLKPDPVSSLCGLLCMLFVCMPEFSFSAWLSQLRSAGYTNCELFIVLFQCLVIDWHTVRGVSLFFTWCMLVKASKTNLEYTVKSSTFYLYGLKSQICLKVLYNFYNIWHLIPLEDGWKHLLLSCFHLMFVPVSCLPLSLCLFFFGIDKWQVYCVFPVPQDSFLPEMKHAAGDSAVRI